MRLYMKQKINCDFGEHFEKKGLGASAGEIKKIIK